MKCDSSFVYTGSVILLRISCLKLFSPKEWEGFKTQTPWGKLLFSSLCGSGHHLTGIIYACKSCCFLSTCPEQSEKHANKKTHQERAQSSREQREVDMILTLEFQTLLNIRHFFFREYLLLTMGNNWRRKWQPTPVFLPGEYHRQRSLAGYSPWGHKHQTWLND